MKVCILTLGCKVNAYESEVIKDLFIKDKNTVVGLTEKPDVVVINTCTVTNQADAKSRKLIRSVKRNNPNAILVVCGCSAQHHQDELLELGIDILIGNKDKTKIVEYVYEFKNNPRVVKAFYDLTNAEFEQMELTNFEGRTRAFVKIQDGCNNFCSYCIIPYIRGGARSRDFNEAYEEIKKLVEKGYKEVVLTGIHTGSYGVETNDSLVTLIQKISKLDGLKRIRISSIEITEITAEFLEELAINPKICDHLHIPLQSGSDSVLKMMNRKYNTAKYMEIIGNIREVRPMINITTDVIVGFPTETDDDFKVTVENIKKLKFGKVHVFPFSKRKGTAAENLTNIVSEKLKKERTDLLLKLSDELEMSYYLSFEGKMLEVLIEDTSKISDGYTSNYIKIVIDEELKHNELYEVIVTAVDNKNVKGKVINFNK